MFEGFDDEVIELSEARVRVRFGGDGPPVLLVHGHPRTGATWHRVAPRLIAAGFRVVCPDMPGYGKSSKPEVTADHRQQSKRAVADVLVELMGVLGHERFAAVGHDRGCYVAFRMALDHPEVVRKLVVMDGIPILDALERCDARFAQRWYHWFFFAQPETPERVINADPMAWYRPDPELMGAENFAELVEAINDPQTVRAMLEDYRAGLGIDREHDLADRSAGHKVACPTLLLWATSDDLELLYGDPLAIWETWASDVRVWSIDSGHHMAEENPGAVADSLIDFVR
ncbi:MAG TPA: alpha/beta hydrolase [Propionibacteriaceae bacterium]|nr:alpha/beta hydrolase [Propionibacteriaceae bacterium]